MIDPTHIIIRLIAGYVFVGTLMAIAAYICWKLTK